MPLKLTLEPPSEPVLADGPIRLSLTLQNAWLTGATAPSVNGTSSFRYSVYSTEPHLLFTASEIERSQAEIRFGEGPDLSAEGFPLAAGSAAFYEDDLTSLLTRAIEPGNYLIEASYRQPDGEICTSERVPLEIVVSKPQAIAQDIAVSAGRVAIAEWHRKEDGSTLLRKRETGVPPLGRFYDLQAYPATAPIHECAISVNAAYGILDYWRWLAWIESGKLLAGVSHYDRWLYPTKPIELGMDAPSLLPFGYTIGGGGAIFLVAGKSAGQRRVRLVSIPPGREAEPVLVDVQSDKLPDALPHATCVWKPDGPPEILLSWMIETSGVNAVLMARVNGLSGEILAPPKGVFITLRPVEAVGFSNVLGPGETKHGQILLAPGPEEPHFTRVSLDLSNPSIQVSSSLPSLEPFSPGPVDRWVLPSESFAGVPVLAIVGKDIWASSTNGWNLVAEGNLDASSVRLWVFSPKRVLCSWFDKDRGYRSQLLS